MKVGSDCGTSQKNSTFKSGVLELVCWKNMSSLCVLCLSVTEVMFERCLFTNPALLTCVTVHQSLRGEQAEKKVY